MSATRGGVCKALLFLFLLFSLGLVSTFAQVPARVVAPVDNAVRVTLAGNIHPLARPELDRGAVAGSQPMTRILLLLQRSDTQEAALQTVLEQQQDKSSPNYHQWLTPAEFGAQYGLAHSDVQAVTQWLESQGFTVAKVYSSKMMIEFSGTAAQVQTAFGTPIHNFEVNGKMYLANTGNPQIPAALAPVVAGVVSLNNFPRQSHVRVAGQARKIAGQPGLQPQFTMPNPGGGTGYFYGVGPGDFATIYNSAGLIAAGNNGTGQTIAVVGETNINIADVQQFRQLFGLPANFTSANIILNGEDPGITSTDEEGEADLDTQWSGAVAPGATIDFVVSASTPASQGIDLSALYIIEYNLAGVMSESYGGCEGSLGVAGNAFYNSLWEQAAAQGITVVLSAGDGGSAGCDDFNTEEVATQGLAVSGLASTPYNVALGGTDFDDVSNGSAYWSPNNTTANASALSYIPEIPWNQNCAQLGLTGCGSSAPQGSLNIVAGSGGASNLYSKPKWQMGVTGIPNDSHRDLPDVSLFASPGFDGNGYIVCQADVGEGAPCSLSGGLTSFLIVGGTSAAAPAFAGIMALVNQYESAHGGSARQGNANPVLYSLVKKSGASCTSSATEAAGCIFNDVTHGNSYWLTYYPGTVGTNSVPCQGGSLNCSSTVASANGVLVEPTNSKIEAWTVGAGYDLATGLGSVNINNLATNWGTVNTVPTTTTLTLSPTTNITHGTGENVTVNVTVTPTTGTATGDVSLIATMSGPNGSTQEGVLQYTLGANGTASGTTQNLPGGSYTVAAHYAGDGTNAPSDSMPPIQVTVSPEASKTFVSLETFDINGNPTSLAASGATYGSGYAILRVDVGDAAATISPSTGISSNCSKGISTCPTGSVTLTSTGTSLPFSSVPLNVRGYGDTAVLQAGTYLVAASYPGDPSYTASTSSTNLTIAVAPTGATVGLGAGYGTSAPVGATVPIVANVTTTSDGAAPTGTIQFLVDGTPLSTPSVVSSNGYVPGNPPQYASANTYVNDTFLVVGTTHTLIAQYSGDTNYAAATSAPVSITVAKTLPYIELGANQWSINVGQPDSLAAAISGPNPLVTPTGTVSFFNGSTAISGTVTYQSGGAELYASMPYTPTVAGVQQITASYSGDNNYLPRSVTSSLTVNGPDFSLTAQPPSSTVISGSSATYTVAVTGVNSFTGSVAFTCAVVAVGTTCSANPPSVAAGNSTTITVTTTKHQLAPPMFNIRPFNSVPKALAYAVIIALLLFCSANFRQRRFIGGAVFAGIVLCATFALTSCGGGGGGGSGSPTTFGTQAGGYVVTISGTSGNLTHTTTVTLSVQ